MPRTVSVSITANTSGFDAGMAGIAGRARSTAQSIKGSFDSNLAGIAKRSADFDRVGGSLTRMGAVAAVGLGLVAKAAIDWESAWAGVTKTVDGSASQMGELEGQLRGLAKTLPASHEQIAAVAEAAGQLGVQRENITAFTKTMIDLGETTNLSADEAATSLAQFMNVMGTSGRNVDRLGATIVALGNAGASTERDIVQMGQRIAGAGRQVGLSETQVLAFSNALASVGIDAEAGGTAISQTFLQIDQAVRQGGKSLDILAKTAGVSSAQFRTAFQRDAAGALNQFIQGLGRVQAEGGDTTRILNSLGITGIRQSDALRRLASSGRLLTDSLKLSSEAWKSNSALVDEAAKRYATTESRAKIAWNVVKDSAITAGQALLPVVAQVASVIGELAQWFGDLPDPARNAAVAIAATAAVVGLLGGGTIKAVVGLSQLRAAFQAAGVASSVAGKAFKIAGLSIPVVGIALFAITSLMQHFASQTADANAAATNYAQAMQTVEGSVTRATAAISANVREAAIQNLQRKGAFDSAKQLGLNLALVTDATLGNKAAIGQVNAALRQNLALNPQLSKGNSDRYNAAVALSQALNGEAGAQIGAIQAEKDRRAAMEGGAGASKAAGDAAKKHAQDVQAEAEALNQATEAAQAAANAILALSGSQIGMESAMDAAAEAAKKSEKYVRKHGDALNVNTETGRQNVQALNSLASATLSYTKTLIENGASAEDVVAANERGRRSWVDTRVAMGGNRREADLLSRTLFALPASVSSQVVLKGAKISQKQADDLNRQIRKLPPETRARIVTIANTKGARAAKQAMAEVKDKQVIARSKGDLKGAKQVDAAMKALRDRLLLARTRGDKRGAQQIEGAMRALRDRTVTAHTRADTSGARAAQAAMNAVQSKTVVINVVERTGKRIKVANNAAGGKIFGPGTETSDDVPINASRNEWVIRASSARKYGDSAMYALNQGLIPKDAFAAYGYKDGGKIGGFAAGGKVDVAAIYRMLTKLTDPLGLVVAADKAVNDATAVLARERAQTAAARRLVLRSRGAARERAQTALDKQLDEERAATEKLTEAHKALTDQQQAVADSARGLSDAYRQQFTSTSTDARDWLDSMRQGTADLTVFGKQVADLRKRGLNESSIQQLVDMAKSGGVASASEAAASIQAGGSGLVKAMNSATGNLQRIADSLGYVTATGKGRYAGGGLLSGAGTATSDSMLIRGSTGEYMVNAYDTARNRGVLDAINYGHAVVRRNFVPGYAGGGMLQRPAPIDTSVIAAAVQAGMRGMTLVATLEGKPFHAMIIDAQRQTGRSLARTR